MSPGSRDRGAAAARALPLLFLLALAALAALAGCPGKDVAKGPSAVDAAAASARPQSTASGAGDASDADDASDAGPLAFPDAVRREQWDAAEKAIAALPDAEQRKAEVRYVRARIALARGKPADTLRLLDRVEDELPLLRDLVTKARAQASLVEGPFERAAEWYGARPDVASWLVAARAWDRAGDATRARAHCDRIVGADRRTRAQEIEARALRMRLLRAKGAEAAAADARWLAVHARDAVAAKEARDLLDALSPPRPLDGGEWLARAKAMAEAAKTDLALEAVERATASRPPPPALELCRARAEVLYKARTRYQEAAQAYQRCAQLGGAHAAEDWFLSARALSRADRDAEAIPAFERVIAKYPKTSWAEDAAFHVARSHALAGKWKEAMQAFDAFARQYPGARERREAERYRALSHLLAQDNKGARKLLEDLAGGAEEGAQDRWTNLAALAALRDGDRTFAVGRWSDVARSRPLSWAALVARARLAELGAPVPAAIEPPPDAASPPGGGPRAAELPSPVDLLHRLGLDGDAEEALREREALVTARASGRGTEALCDAYGALDRGRRRYALSLAAPSGLLQAAPGPRSRWAWECSFPRPHEPFVRASAASARLAPELVWAVMRQESAFDPEVVSPARAVGLLQLMPETASAVAKKASLTDDAALLVQPSHNIALGTLYLRELVDQLGGNVPLAVAAYNAGPEAITRWRARAKEASLDAFVEAIPFVETRGYVVRVMSNLARYGFLERGDAGIPHVALDLETR